MLEALARLLAEQKEWEREARAHGEILARQRLSELPASVQALEERLERIVAAEERRLELMSELSGLLGHPVWEAPLPLLALASLLPDPWALKLKVCRVELAEQARRNGELARRNQGLAETGQRVAAGVVRTISELSVRRARSPEAYSRTGAARKAVAVPVFQRAWRA